jgi:FkbM family methyltransferase
MLDKTEMVDRTLGKLRKHKKSSLKATEKLREDYIEGDTHRALRTADKFPASEFNTLIDVGASDGRWGRHRVRDTDKQVVFFEPNPYWKGSYEKLKKPGEHMVWKAAWDSEATLNLKTMGDNPYIGEVWENSKAGTALTVPTTRVDTVVKNLELPGPYWLKIDGHGSDWKILGGCSGILDSIVGINFEANNFKITPTTIPMVEMLMAYQRLGFRLYWMGHIVQFSGCFWEAECILLREDHPLFDTALAQHRRVQNL